MRYDLAREILAEAIEALDERKLFDPILGHGDIDRNPKARKFNPKTARPNKVRKRKLEMGLGRAGYGLNNPESKSVNDGRYMLRDRISEESTGKKKYRNDGGVHNARYWANIKKLMSGPMTPEQEAWMQGGADDHLPGIGAKARETRAAAIRARRAKGQGGRPASGPSRPRDFK